MNPEPQRREVRDEVLGESTKLLPKLPTKFGGKEMGEVRDPASTAGFEMEF